MKIFKTVWLVVDVKDKHNNIHYDNPSATNEMMIKTMATLVKMSIPRLSILPNTIQDLPWSCKTHER